MDLNCDCATYARDGGDDCLWNHHPNCEKHDKAADMRAVITALVRGIEAWANDEDGVHYLCWDAYADAKSRLMENVSLTES